MKRVTSLAACLLAAALAACGGGGGTNNGAGANGNGSTDQANNSVAQIDDNGTQANGGATQTQFPLRSMQQGDERTYEFADTFSDSSKRIYSWKTVQTVLNADGSGERQVFDALNRLIEAEIHFYDKNGGLSRYFASTGVTCQYNAARNYFTSPASVGQSFENKITDTCNNGYSAVIDETGTITGSETITVNGASYSTLKAIITENGVMFPPAPEPSYSYSITRTEWIEPSLGLIVKGDAFYTLAAPTDGIYLTSRNITLKSYLNK